MQLTQDESSVTDENEEKNSLASSTNQYGQVLIMTQYDQKRSVLIVAVKMAKDLIVPDGKETSTACSLDSFARIMIVPDRKKKTKRKTRIFKESLNPTWNESFEFSDMNLSDVRLKSIDLLVKNSKSLFSREKSFLGQCVIQLNSIENLEQGHTGWYQLQDQTFCSGLLKKLLD